MNQTGTVLLLPWKAWRSRELINMNGSPGTQPPRVPVFLGNWVSGSWGTHKFLFTTLFSKTCDGHPVDANTNQNPYKHSGQKFFLNPLFADGRLLPSSSHSECNLQCGIF